MSDQTMGDLAARAIVTTASDGSSLNPAPWRWSGRTLTDAADAVLVSAEDGGPLSVPSPSVRELIRVAPVMEDLLRRIEWNATPINTAVIDRFCCPCCDGHRDRGHIVGCQLAALLAALDAARQGTT